MDEQNTSEVVESDTETTPLSTGQTTNYTEADEAGTADAPDRRVDTQSLNTFCSAMGWLIKFIMFIIFIVVLYKYNKLSNSCDPNVMLDDKMKIASLEAQLTTVLTTSDQESFQRTLKESKNRLNSLKIPSGHYVRFNAASYVDGARVIGRQSFLSSRYSRDQTGYVLFERDELPLDRAWCSDGRKTVLTIHLSRNTTPLAVSYQHTKHYDRIPFGAPFDYDVYACYDSECNAAFALVTDCKYHNPSPREKGKEQICNITQNLFDTEVNTIQFRFKENHGNVDKTCVYLIRVYGEKRPSRPEFHQRNGELCREIAHDYYHSPFSYLMRNKSCSTLYSNKCCKDCPECCRECEIEDFNSSYLSGFVIGIIFIALPMTIFILCPCGFIVYQIYRNRKNKKEPDSTEPNEDVNNDEPYQATSES